MSETFLQNKFKIFENGKHLCNLLIISCDLLNNTVPTRYINHRNFIKESFMIVLGIDVSDIIKSYQVASQKSFIHEPIYEF